VTSDASLILRARGGDEGAWAELTKRYDNFIRFVANTYFLPDGEHEDLVQEGFHGLFKAVRDYRPDRGVPFRSFAELCIRRQIVTALKRASRRGNRPLNEAVSFSKVAVPTRDGAEMRLEEVLPGREDEDPIERLCAREELTVFARGAAALSPLERAVAFGIGSGESYRQLSARLGQSEKAVDNAAQRAKRKFAQALAVLSSAESVDTPDHSLEEVPSEPTTSERIEAFLWRNPGSTIKQIAEGIDIDYERARACLHAGWPGLTKAKATPRGKRWLWYMFRRNKVAA
jgi:RNA polymerase sporulation-specific sigma factor